MLCIAMATIHTRARSFGISVKAQATCCMNFLNRHMKNFINLKAVWLCSLQKLICIFHNTQVRSLIWNTTGSYLINSTVFRNFCLEPQGSILSATQKILRTVIPFIFGGEWFHAESKIQDLKRRLACWWVCMTGFRSVGNENSSGLGHDEVKRLLHLVLMDISAAPKENISLMSRDSPGPAAKTVGLKSTQTSLHREQPERVVWYLFLMLEHHVVFCSYCISSWKTVGGYLMFSQ